MTPSSPEQVQKAYEYLKWCRADISQNTVVLDSTRISKLTLAKAVPFKKKVNNLFLKFRTSLPCAPFAPIAKRLTKI
jgi:hypothetical protein